MNKHFVLLVAIFFLGLADLCFADAPVDPSGVGFLPKAHELFQPLLADPRELQFALRVMEPVSRKLVGEAAMGDYLGFYRWAVLGGRGYAQISMGGGAFARFDLAGTTNDMQTVDFFGNLPFDLRIGKWAYRFMPYHTSSHLGDDYLKATGGVTSKHSWDNLKWLASYDLSDRVRLYGGYTYVFRSLPGAGRSALQSGFEASTPWFENGCAQGYWANDFQSWERASWNPEFNSQLGVKMVRNRQDDRAISLFLEFGAGRRPEGQFYLNPETHWVLGIKFQLT